MWAALGTLLTGLVGSFLGRVLAGAGLALVTFGALQAVVDQLMLMIQSYMAGLPSQVAAIVTISGVGDGLSLIGSAFLARVAIVAASVGVKKAAG